MDSASLEAGNISSLYSTLLFIPIFPFGEEQEEYRSLAESRLDKEWNKDLKNMKDEYVNIMKYASLRMDVSWLATKT